MTRLINKKDCTFEDHYIVKGDEIIPIELDVHDQLSMLEGMYQIALWLSKKPDYSAAPDVSDWRMESLIEEELPQSVPDTPAIDAKVQETLAFLDDLDTVNFCKNVNELIGKFADLIRFARGDRFIEGYHAEMFDNKYLGNPLELTEGRIMDVIEFIAKQGERYHINIMEEAKARAEISNRMTSVLEF